MKASIPPWVIFHVPHDSSYIPPQVRQGIFLNDEQLNEELLFMCDLWTLALYGNGIPFSQIVSSPICRLVVDVERFSDDKDEVMAQRGMGVIYTSTHCLRRLRRCPSKEERKFLLNNWYWPHHLQLTRKVNLALENYGKAFVVDLHSFASKALPYEENSGERPEICIGTDPFHTTPEIQEAFFSEFSRSFDTDFNSPFSGALVPIEHYKKDRRVHSVMIETRRDLYEDERNGQLLTTFVQISKRLQNCLLTAISKSF